MAALFMRHIISWSGGKDSTASIILFHNHETDLMRPGDEVIILFVEIMFDKRGNISGHNPDMIRFIYEKKRIFESWGYRVEILRGDMDFLDVFYHRLKGSPDPERNGLTHGFPLPGGMCAVKRDCKLAPLDEWERENSGEDVIRYVGIASDEPKRLTSLHRDTPNAVSLLEKYGITEAGARRLCAEHDMLSPLYSLSDSDHTQKRDGCWFCPYAKLCEHKSVKEQIPDAWKKYVSLEDTPNLAYPKWNIYAKESLHQRDELLEYQMRYRQLSVFDLIA